MKQVTPRQFIDASGFLIFIGCVPLAIGYAATDLLNTDSLMPSIAGVVTGIVGFKIGERLRPLLASFVPEIASMDVSDYWRADALQQSDELVLIILSIVILTRLKQCKMLGCC